MEWIDEGMVLGARPHGETSVVLEAMTPDYGRHLGLVKGGRSQRLRPVLQPGNGVQLTWKARLESHLGLYSVELVEPRAATLMASAAGLYAVQIVAGHLGYLAEREPHGGLYRAAVALIDNAGEILATAALVARFELMLLEELGFGLDLAVCAATGTTRDLVYVSPKTGRAVSRDAGVPYAARLLPLPAFLREGGGEAPDAAAVAEGLRLTGFFLERHVCGPRARPLTAARAEIQTKISALAEVG